MSFFEPVYSNGHVDLLADGIPRPAMENDNRKESNPRADIEIVLEEPSDVKYFIQRSLLVIIIEF